MKKIRHLCIGHRVMGTKDYCKLFLWIPQVLLQAIYFWPRQQNTKYKKPVVFVIAAILFNFMNIGLIIEFISIMDNWFKIALHLPFLTVGFQATAKILLIYYNSEELELIMDDIIYKFWPYDLLETKIKNELKTFYYVIVIIMISLIFIGTVYALLVVITPWSSREFPFQVAYPYFDYKASPYYEIIYFSQVITIHYLMYCSVLGCDYSFMGICSSVITQHKLLQHALLAFNTPLMEEVNGKLRDIGGLDLEAKNYSLHKEYFVRCVNHHHLLLEITKKLNRMYSSIEMVQLTVSMTGICIGLFTLTSMGSSSVSTKIIVWMFTLIYFNELFQYCAIGNELNYQASFLPDYIFRCNWHTLGDNELTKDLTFMLQRAQDIPKLTAYNLYEINLDFYIRVVKLSFSVYTFLSKMKENE